VFRDEWIDIPSDRLAARNTHTYRPAELIRIALFESKQKAEKEQKQRIEQAELKKQQELATLKMMSVYGNK
jgi:predicted kinase